MATIRENGISFKLKLNFPIKETIESIDVGRRIATDNSL